MKKEIGVLLLYVVPSVVAWQSTWLPYIDDWSVKQYALSALLSIVSTFLVMTVFAAYFYFIFHLFGIINDQNRLQ